MTTREQVEAGARRHARSAALRNTGLQACPYPAEGTPLQSVGRRVWIRAYLHRRPQVDAVDYTSDVDELAAGDVVDQDVRTGRPSGDLF